MSIIVFLRRNVRKGPINLIQGLTTTSARSNTTRGYDGSTTRSAHKRRTRVDQKEGRTDTHEHALSLTKHVRQMGVHKTQGSARRPLTRLER